MKKNLLLIILLFCAFSLSAQWIQVNNGLPDFPPTSMVNWVDTMVVSTYGGGIYLTYDQGENWSEMPGTLPNLFVNKINYQGGQFDPIIVSTDGGPFTCVNGGYIDCNGTGLPNTAVNFWSGTGGNWDLVKDAIVGTNGDGIYAANYTSPFIYEWFPSNPGITGDGLYINDGLVSESWAWLATEGGACYANLGDTEWSLSSDGLVGDALRINTFTYLGAWIIATDGGLFSAMSFTDTWAPVIPDEKFNISLYMNTDVSPSGFMFYALGENGYYTQDFVTWHQIDFEGIPGEVTAAAADEENLYVGFTSEDKGGKLNGGMYRRPLEEFVVGIENHLDYSTSAVLEQNYPNPASNSTQISYTLLQKGHTCINVFDMMGKKIHTLLDEKQAPGRYTLTFETGDLPAGIYHYTMQFNNQYIATRKMVINK